MHAAAARFDLHVPHARSLKQKRAVIRPLVEGLRNRLHLSVAEVDHHDRWQRAAIAVAVVAESDRRLRELLAAVEHFVRSIPDVELIDVEVAELVADPGWLGPSNDSG
jgi:uncharacterized protein YlxP (DUF503 family)